MPTRPNQIIQSDSDAAGAAGITDGPTQVKLPARGANDFHDYMRVFTRINEILASSNMGRVVATNENPLAIGAQEIHFVQAGMDYYFAGETGFAVTDDATNYIYLDSAAILKKDTTAWPVADHFRLAVVVTAGGAITSITDRRFQNFQLGGASSWSATAANNDVDVNSNNIVNVDTIVLEDAGDPAAEGEIRRNGDLLNFHDSTDVRKIHTDAAAITVPEGGTGLATLPDRQIIVGRGTAAVDGITAGAAGVPLLGAGGAANPVFAALDLSLTEVSVTEKLSVANGGTGKSEKPVPFLWTIEIPDALIAKEYLRSVYVPRDITITGATVSVETAPTTQPIILDILDEGVSIFSGVQANMPQVAATDNDGNVKAFEYNMAKNRRLTFEFEQVGSGTPGSDARITLWGKETFV